MSARRLGTALAVATAALALGTPPASAATPVRVASASWSTPSAAWVLGTTGCADASCTTVAATGDGGATWSRLAAPRSPIAPSGGNGVDDIERADAVNGYAYRPQLFVTHDGAATWQRLALPGGGRQVTSLTTSGGYAYITVNDCVIGNPANCSAPATLWRSPVSSDAWTQLPASLPARGFPQLSSSEDTVYVTGASDRGAPYLLVSTDGRTFDPRPSPCTVDPTISSLRVAPSAEDNALLVCSEAIGLGRTSKQASVSTDAARTSTSRGQAPEDGSLTGLAAQGRTGLLAVSGGAGQIVRTADAGATFDVTYQTRSSTMSDPQLIGRTGSVVRDPATYQGAQGQLLLSHDGGLTWAPTEITVS